MENPTISQLELVQRVERAKTTIEIVIDAYIAIRRTESTFDIKAKEQLKILCGLALGEDRSK